MSRLHWIGLAVALQMGVLGAEYLVSVWPLWTGRELRLEIVPVDPRSWFRGNYARLDYRVARLDAALFEGPPERLRKGEIVYVSLVEEKGLWRAARVQRERPDSGVFLRGRLARGWPGPIEPLRVRYGIEAWFAPREKALEIERVTRARAGEEALGVAVVRVSRSGRAALARLELP